MYRSTHIHEIVVYYTFSELVLCMQIMAEKKNIWEPMPNHLSLKRKHRFKISIRLKTAHSQFSRLWSARCNQHCVMEFRAFSFGYSFSVSELRRREYTWTEKEETSAIRVDIYCVSFLLKLFNDWINENNLFLLAQNNSHLRHVPWKKRMIPGIYSY